MHELGYVHNDIKLQNIVIGHLDTDKVYLIDFGLATRYRTDYEQHVPKTKAKFFKGNVLFCSMSQSLGYNTGRGDDITSALFLLIFLLNDSKLPWSETTRDKDQKSIPLKERLMMKTT